MEAANLLKRSAMYLLQQPILGAVATTCGGSSTRSLERGKTFIFPFLLSIFFISCSIYQQASTKQHYQ
jgi:hypothetical protein